MKASQWTSLGGQAFNITYADNLALPIILYLLIQMLNASNKEDDD
ncbi:hypothetical protein [Paenibacillus sp. NPDC057967]